MRFKLFENFGNEDDSTTRQAVIDALVELGYGPETADNLIEKHIDIYETNVSDDVNPSDIAENIEEAEMQSDEEELEDDDINESLDDDLHHCDACKEVMSEGYVIDGGEQYFCSKKCLHSKYTDEQWESMYSDDGESYWTVWEEEPQVKTQNQLEEGD